MKKFSSISTRNPIHSKLSKVQELSTIKGNGRENLVKSLLDSWTPTTPSIKSPEYLEVSRFGLMKIN
jgi:hypothetical protein